MTMWNTGAAHNVISLILDFSFFFFFFISPKTTMLFSLHSGAESISIPHSADVAVLWPGYIFSPVPLKGPANNHYLCLPACHPGM